MSIRALQSAVTNAGGTPTQHTHIGLLRELISAWGGTPSHFSIIELLRDAIQTLGSNPTQFSTVFLLRELVIALGGTPSGFDAGALYDQVASLADSGGPVTPLAIIYDTRYGTDPTTAASTGWFTFGLKPGCRRVWLNSIEGNDANDGLSAATAKQTFAAAFALFIGGGSPGDQLMIAGTGGRTYTDNNVSNWTLKNGFSTAYPTAALCYDPADPANSAKYGKLFGSDRPRVVPTGSSFSFNCSSENGGASNYYAVAGIHFDGSARVAATGNSPSVSYMGRHDGVVHQNCKFEQSFITIDNSGSALGYNVGSHVSKCSFFGATTTATCVALFLSYQDGHYCQDNVFHHNGWRIGASRDDTAANGGPTWFSHAHYYHATCINGRFDRNVYVDSAHDGANIRGGASATCLVTLDEPVAGVVGGFSSQLSEAPDGRDFYFDDRLIMGADNLNLTYNQRAWGCYPTNNKPGSYIRNMLMFDNPFRTQSSSCIMAVHDDDSANIDMHLDMFNVRTYNWSSYLNTGTGGIPSKIYTTWTDCLLDTLTPVVAGNNTFTNTRIHNGLTDYPNAKTRDEVVSALLTLVGITPSATSYAARKAQLVNIMCYRPEHPWAQMFVSIAFPAYGMTAKYSVAVTPPTLTSDTPPVIYTGDDAVPGLSSPTASKTGATTATVGVTTDRPNGSIYWVVTTSGTQPSAIQIRAGQDATGTTATASGAITVSSTGAKAAAVTGLTGGVTYYAHFMHQSATGIRSTISSSASFTDAAFTPASLSPIYWHEADPTKLYKDAGTTLVSADGDPVQQVTSKAGQNLSQGTLSQRPLYQSGGGKPYLTLDGVDDYLQTASAFAATDANGAHWIAATVYFNSALNSGGHGQTAVDLKFADTGWLFSDGSAKLNSYDSGGTVTQDAGPAVTAGTPVVLIAVITATSAEVYVNGVSNGPTALTGTRATAASLLIVGSDAGAFGLQGRWYGECGGAGTLSSTDIANLNTYMRALAP